MTNFLEKLLNGQKVEWKKLGEVCEVKKGRQLNKELLTEMGEYPAYNGGTSYSGFTNTYNYNENTIIVSQGGASAGFVNFVTTKFYANAHCYVILPDFKKVENRYVYHFLKLNEEKLTQKQHGAGIPALRTDELLSLPIPIPPLSVQAEIVEILDTLTTHTAELTAELTARKKQYNHYREKLLTFGEGVEWKKLGEVCELKRGKRLVRSELEEVGTYAVYQNSMTPLGYYHEGNVNADTTFIICAGAAGEIGYSDIAFWAADDVYICLNSDNILSKFLYYYLLTQQNKISSQVRRASIPRLSKSSIDGLLTPLPPLAVQREIVDILDKFDALTTSITEGLPREIELRQKQYEYYRNQLLNFDQ